MRLMHILAQMCSKEKAISRGGSIHYSGRLSVVTVQCVLRPGQEWRVNQLTREGQRGVPGG